MRRAERRLLALERDDVIRLALQNLPDDVPLASRGVYRDDRALEVEDVEEIGYRRDLVGLLVRLHLPDDELRTARVGADDAGYPAALRERAAEVLPVDRDDVPEDVRDGREPGRGGGLRPKCLSSQQADFVHKLKLAQKELKESRVWLLFASRLSPGPRVEALRTESRELLLMIGKSINTATARIRDETLGA